MLKFTNFLPLICLVLIYSSRIVISASSPFIKQNNTALSRSKQELQNFDNSSEEKNKNSLKSEVKENNEVFSSFNDYLHYLKAEKNLEEISESTSNSDLKDTNSETGAVDSTDDANLLYSIDERSDTDAIIESITQKIAKSPSAGTLNDCDSNFSDNFIEP